MPFYCKWWDCPLEDVTEHQQEECKRNGMNCVQCMETADVEEAADGSAERIGKEAAEHGI